MAVFTPLTESDVRSFLAGYAVGDLVGFEGIAAGIENSNFFVDTTCGRYVLTIFERLSAQQLPAYLGLMRHLAARGIACPDPVARQSGELQGTLHGKPCALVTRLTGRSVERATAEHCARVGALLAAMHRAAANFTTMPDNPRGRRWWAQTAPQVHGFLDAAQRTLLETELAEQQAFAASADFTALPAGPVHADLFRDNVLFGEPRPDETAPRLSGVIDFYFAGCDSWLYDLAVTANDWCIDEASGEFDHDRLQALLAAYRRERSLTAPETRAWPAMLRAAALRFWLSRLHDLHCPRPAEVIEPKDPAHFERILRARRLRVPALD
jgi:homoserine kinase type II